MTQPTATQLTCSVVIPTYGRDEVLLDTVRYLLQQQPPALEVVLVDQTPRHGEACEAQLAAWQREGRIVWQRQKEPSVTEAMNRGLLLAKGDIVLFVDDDVVPAPQLVAAHVAMHQESGPVLVVGRVTQPWDTLGPDGEAALTKSNPYAGGPPGPRDEFIGCNFSVPREPACGLGGFDGNFVKVAYRYEAEFSQRWLRAGYRIWFEPAAALRHLKALAGGTRAYGDHLRTARPSHSVGEYYFLLRARPAGWLGRWLLRPWRSVRTRHHLTRPWWIPVTLCAELAGSAWALWLWLRGPRLLGRGAGARMPAPAPGLEAL